MKYFYLICLLLFPQLAFAKSHFHHHHKKHIQYVSKYMSAMTNYRKQKNCFIHAMLMETRGVKVEKARVEVGRVILSRLLNKHFPKSVCGVYYQRHVYSHKKVCEFSDVCHYHHKKPFTKEDYEIAQNDMYKAVRLTYKLGPTPFLYFTSNGKCPVRIEKRKRIGPFVFCKPNQQLI